MTDKQYLINAKQLDQLLQNALLTDDIAMLQSLPMVDSEPVACFIGMQGSAYDLPTTKRAYTYEQQPNNIVANKLGRACNAASLQSAGDNLDRGLGLLQELQKTGFGVFDLGAEFTQTTSLQALTHITAADVTPAMHQEWSKIFRADDMSIACPKDGAIMAAAYNAVIQHRSEAK